MERKHVILAAGLAAIGTVALAVSLRRGDTARRIQPEPSGRDPLIFAGDRIVLCGDSLGVGLRKPMADLAAADGLEFTGIAVGGTAVFQWAKRRLTIAGKPVGTEPIMELSPTVVLVSLGTNDGAMPDASIENERSSVQTFVQTVCGSGARMVWLLPPPEVNVPRLAHAVEVITGSPAVSEWGVVFYRTPAGSVQLQSADRIHPTAVGYKAWAEDVWAFLNGT